MTAPLALGLYALAMFIMAAIGAWQGHRRFAATMCGLGLFACLIALLAATAESAAP